MIFRYWHVLFGKVYICCFLLSFLNYNSRIAFAEKTDENFDFEMPEFPHTISGNSVSNAYGKIYIIGDSLLDGRGSTEGIVEAKLSDILSTTVVNNAVSGFSLQMIAEVPSCSQDKACKWTIINGGINRDESVTEVVSMMTSIVERELDQGSKVIIQGYPRDCGLIASGQFIESMHDSYLSLAARKTNVWMIDARTISGHPLMATPCNPESRIYRVEDNSHPSPLAGEVFAEEAAKIIMAESSGTTIPPAMLANPPEEGGEESALSGSVEEDEGEESMMSDSIEEEEEQENIHLQFPYGINFPKATSGNIISSIYGKIYIIGDSLLDGNDVEVRLSNLLTTTVVNNAVGGFAIPDVVQVPACSQDNDCKWTVIGAGINGDRANAPSMMTALVERELAKGRKVILQGYPPDCGLGAAGKDFEKMLDSYASLAASRDDVWMIDCRNLPNHPLMGTPCEPASRPYRSGDNSHPSPKASQVFAEEVSRIILNESGISLPPSIIGEDSNDCENLNFPYGVNFPVVWSGSTTSSLYGKIYFLGDSFFDGTLNLWKISEDLSTTIASNAVGGFTFDDISQTPACSQDIECLWTIITGGIKGNRASMSSQMTNLVEREITAGKRVILIGYARDCGIYFSGDSFERMLDSYVSLAARTANVWMIDPRNLPEHSLLATPCNPESRFFRAEDNSHPSLMTGEILLDEVVKIIKANPGTTLPPAILEVGEEGSEEEEQSEEDLESEEEHSEEDSGSEEGSGEESEEIEFPDFPRVVSGTAISSFYGKVYIIGDSFLDGLGPTEGIIEETLSSILATTVINNAVSDFTIPYISEVPACAWDSDCLWTLINGGINGDRESAPSEMVNLVERELDEGKKVILIGYTPDCEGYASGDLFEKLLDSYVSLAESKENVWALDARSFPDHPLMATPCDPASHPYRRDGDFHMSPLSGKIFAEKAAEIIMTNSDVQDSSEEEEENSGDADFDHSFSSGTTVSDIFGKIYINGDSLFGLPQVEENLANLLNATVVKTAIGGFAISDLVDFPACSDDSECKWTILAGGLNGDRTQSPSAMTEWVERELDGGSNVIIQGYAPDCDGYASGELFEDMLDSYVSLAAGKENVWMVDARSIPDHPLIGKPCDPASRKYRADDNSHPSILTVEIFAQEWEKIIRSNTQEEELPSEPGIAFCLSGDSTVESLERGTIPLSQLRLGECIHVGNGKFESVYSFGHYGPDVRGAEMQKITTDSDTTFTISDDHLIFLDNGKVIPSRELSIGSKIQSSSGIEERITSIRRIKSKNGVYAPFTPSGKFVVGGSVVVSCYVAMLQGGSLEMWSLSQHWLAHSFTFPRRFLCMNFMQCYDEKYDPESGVALWIIPGYNRLHRSISDSSPEDINPFKLFTIFLGPAVSIIGWVALLTVLSITFLIAVFQIHSGKGAF